MVCISLFGSLFFWRGVTKADEFPPTVEHPLALKPDGKGRLTCGNVVGTREIPPDDDNFKRSLGEEESSWVEAGDVDGAELMDEYVD